MRCACGSFSLCKCLLSQLITPRTFVGNHKVIICELFLEKASETWHFPVIFNGLAILSFGHSHKHMYRNLYPAGRWMCQPLVHRTRFYEMLLNIKSSSRSPTINFGHSCSQWHQSFLFHLLKATKNIPHVNSLTATCVTISPTLPGFYSFCLLSLIFPVDCSTSSQAFDRKCSLHHHHD